VTEQDVVDMNRRLGGAAAINAPVPAAGGSGEWPGWLFQDAPDTERTLVESGESGKRHKAPISPPPALTESTRGISEARRVADDPITLEELAAEFGVSRERVRQIEVRAFEKVQKAVKTRMAAMEKPAEAEAAIAAH